MPTTPTSVFCPYGLAPSRFTLWQQNRPRLRATIEGKDFCSYCSSVKELGVHSNERLRVDKAFVDRIKISEITSRRIKKLNDKIAFHGKSASHSICIEIMLTKEKTCE